MMQTRLGNNRRRGKRARKALWIIGLAAVAWVAVVTLRTGSAPTISIEPDMPGIGKRTSIRLYFAEPSRGLRRVEVSLIQAERVEPLAEKHWETRPPWSFWGPAQLRAEMVLEVGSETVEGLRSGTATLRASAWPAATWLRRPEPHVVELELPVRLTPPAVQVLSTRHYVSQGGSGVVVYSLDEAAVSDGVEVGDWWFPGYRLPDGEGGHRFSLFAVPFDLSDPAAIRLTASDGVGNRAEVLFVDEFFQQRFRVDTLEISDEFMQRVVPSIMSSTPGFEDQGELLQNYLWINGELRRRNAEKLAELGAQSRPEFLWDRAFLPLASGQVMSAFADRRTYRYRGQEVDRQDHLGFDLASTQQAEIQAANRGVVELADYFGIYGNTVVIDHGFGLMSLYGHLSSIAVERGQRVERGDIIGRSGQSGLAGGDHLHFTLLIRGHPVNPVEWWDRAWIRDRFAAKLGSAFQFQP